MTRYFLAFKTRKGVVVGQRIYSSPSSAMRTLNSLSGQRSLKENKVKKVQIVSY